jgi:hypothetical protein
MKKRCVAIVIAAMFSISATALPQDRAQEPATKREPPRGASGDRFQCGVNRVEYVIYFSPKKET